MDNEIEFATLAYLCGKEDDKPKFLVPVFLVNSNELVVPNECLDRIVGFRPVAADPSNIRFVPQEKVRNYYLGECNVHAFAFSDGSVKIGSRPKIFEAIQGRMHELIRKPKLRSKIALWALRGILPELQTTDGRYFAHDLDERISDFLKRSKY